MDPASSDEERWWCRGLDGVQSDRARRREVPPWLRRPSRPRGRRLDAKIETGDALSVSLTGSRRAMGTLLATVGIFLLMALVMTAVGPGRALAMGGAGLGQGSQDQTGRHQRGSEAPEQSSHHDSLTPVDRPSNARSRHVASRLEVPPCV